MSFAYKFQKILTIKESEKKRAQESYQISVKNFEEVAEKLYHFLRKKEELEAIQLEKISFGLSVIDIRHHQQFIANIEKTISHYQKLVLSARQKMMTQEEALLEKNIEVKKYEKIREKEYALYQHLITANESRLMDEISIQQFMKKES